MPRNIHYDTGLYQGALRILFYVLAAIINTPLVDKTILTRLQNWYLINCDSTWEHSYGISINTLDNPGWTIKIDLTDTCLEDLQYEKQFDNDSLDWLSIRVKEKVFEGSGDPTKLTTILTIFLDEIIPKYSHPDFQYDIYVQLRDGPTKIWRPVKAKMISEDTLQITHIPDLNYSDIVTLSLDGITFEKEDIFNFKSTAFVGDNIKIELIETINGVTLIAKE